MRKSTRLIRRNPLLMWATLALKEAEGQIQMVKRCQSHRQNKKKKKIKKNSRKLQETVTTLLKSVDRDKAKKEKL
ncbi:hypothetical protein GJ744_009692 [Endocarpon pusillum]|uniref:Uncharacterized protein n=1 Tax=Endocarpon pusillum TaxID=364733 RepID=A0A8H7AU86_9EURO|nr:hypothetical protein GJ744_009692 [Endocarpon pusillum]